MPSTESILLLAKWEWTNTILRAADNRHPSAYITAAICGVFVVICVFHIARVLYLLSIGEGDQHHSWISLIKPALLLSVLAYFLYEIGRRLIG